MIFDKETSAFFASKPILLPELGKYWSDMVMKKTFLDFCLHPGRKTIFTGSQCYEGLVEHLPAEPFELKWLQHRGEQERTGREEAL